MRELILESYGKVNLALDILYKRKDGYHEIKSIMQEIDIKDRLTFREQKEGITLESNSWQMPRNSENLVYRAWEKLSQISGVKKGLHVNIEKNIPIYAGLGGGSSNGATTLKALNYLWDLKLRDQELMDIGKELGADVPFFIKGGTALAEGIGEELTSLKSFSDKYILLINPGINMSTAQTYKKTRPNGDRLDIEGLVKAIEEDNIKKVAEKLSNKLEEVAIEEYPVIEEIKESMIKEGALGALMSGSGSTVFGLFEDQESIEAAHKILKKRWEKTCWTKTR